MIILNYSSYLFFIPAVWQYFFSFFDLHLFFGFCHFVYLYWFEPHMVNCLVSVCCSTTAWIIILLLIILLLVFFGVFDNDYRYRTRNIHLSLSAKICICFSQHHAALKDQPHWEINTINTFQTFLWIQTTGSTSLRERHTHWVYYQRKHSCSPLSRCVCEMQITMI